MEIVNYIILNNQGEDGRLQQESKVLSKEDALYYYNRSIEIYPNKIVYVAKILTPEEINN